MTRGLPPVPVNGDASTRRFLEGVRDKLSTLTDGSDRSVTLSDLKSSTFLTNYGIGGGGSGGGSTTYVQFDPSGLGTPPAPVALEITGAFQNVILTWARANWPYYAASRIYRNNVDNFGTAAVIANVDATIYADRIGTGQSFFYWVTNVSIANIESAPSRVGGVVGTTNVQIDVQDLKNQIVDATKIAPNAVDITKFANGIRPVETVAALPNTGNFVGRMAFLTTDEKLYRYTSTGWTRAIPAADIGGQLVTAQIAPNAISADKLSALFGGGNLLRNSGFARVYVGGPKGNVPHGFGEYDNDNGATAWTQVLGRTSGYGWQISWNTDSTSKGLVTANTGVNNFGLLQPNSTYVVSFYAKATGSAVGLGMQTAWNVNPTAIDTIANPPLSGAWQRYIFRIHTGATADSSVYITKQYDGVPRGVGSLTLADIQLEEGEVATAYAPALLPGEIIDTYIADNAITTAKIAANQITAVKIAAATITSNEIAAHTITGTNIYGQSITAAELAADSVIAGKVAAGAINTRELAAYAVTATKVFIGDTSNMVVDSDFADGAYWGNNFGLAWISSPAPSGFGYASKFYASIVPNGGNVEWFSLPISVEGGKDYFASIIPVTTNGNALASGFVNWFADTAGNAYLGTTTLGQHTGTFQSAAANRMSLLVKAPATAQSARFIINRQPAGDNSGRADFAEPILRRASSGELIVDGSITTNKIGAQQVIGTHILGDTITGDKIKANQISASHMVVGTITADSGIIASLNADKITVGTLDATRLTVGGVAWNKLNVNSLATVATDSDTGTYNVTTLGTALTIPGLSCQVATNPAGVFVLEYTFSMRSWGVVTYDGNAQAGSRAVFDGGASFSWADNDGHTYSANFACPRYGYGQDDSGFQVYTGSKVIRSLALNPFTANATFTVTKGPTSYDDYDAEFNVTYSYRSVNVSVSNISMSLRWTFI